VEVRRSWVSHVLWCALATTAFALLTDVHALTYRLGDTDDATRLVEVRELVNGSPWYDTTLPRVGAPQPLVSHWSRLIDAPLALLIVTFSHVVGAADAEIIARVVWPLALVFALLMLTVRDAYRRGGTRTAALTLVLVTTSVTAMVQFRPGRIDHHNAMIVCTIGGLIFLARTLEEQGAGWPAGALLGLALLIGYEPIPLIVPALGVYALAGVWTGRGRGPAGAVTATTATMFLGLVATTRIDRLLQVHCDTVSVNILLFGLCCTAGMWLSQLAARDRRIRMTILLGSAAAGFGVFAALAPACLHGPYGEVDARLWPVFLDQLLESQSIASWLVNNPAFGWSFVGFVAAAAVAHAALWRRDRHVTSGLALITFSIAALMGVSLLRLTPYVSWLAALAIARFIPQLPDVRVLGGRHTRITATVLLSQAGMMLVLAPTLAAYRQLRGAPASEADAAAGISANCADARAMAPLAALPGALVAGDIELGPFIVAWSSHRVVAAPYHRLNSEILANDALLASRPEDARRDIEQLGVSYIALCQDVSAGRRRVLERTAAQSLRARLLRNEPVEYLHELTTGPSAAVRVWRVYNPSAGL